METGNGITGKKCVLLWGRRRTYIVSYQCKCVHVERDRMGGGELPNEEFETPLIFV